MRYLAKIIVSFFLAALLTHSVKEGYARETVFGVKGGMNLSNLTLENNNDKNILAGFHLGGWLSLPLSSKFSIQPELLYSTRGTRWEIQQSQLTADAELKLNYLDFPVNLVYHLARDVDFQAGPYIGFLLGASSQATLSSGTGSLSIVESLDKNNFQSTDFGLQGGMRFALKPVYLGFTYKLGLSEVAAKDGNARNFFGDASNRSVQLFVGYAFSSK
jgi:hypothetical protein